jgi:PiT family inorganic phosphate transporter
MTDQKGMGLIMLILIGTVPTVYALNHAVTLQQSQDFIAVSQQAAQVLDHYVQPGAVIGDARDDVTEFLRSKESNANTLLAIRTLVNDIGNETSIYPELWNVPNDRLRNFRNDLCLVSEVLRIKTKTGQPKFSPPMPHFGELQEACGALHAVYPSLG